jgi:hypothetical protein
LLAVAVAADVLAVRHHPSQEAMAVEAVVFQVQMVLTHLHQAA